MARLDGDPGPISSAPGAPGPANADPSLVSGQDPPRLFGMDAAAWYSTGFAGNADFTPQGVGAGESSPEGSVLGSAIITIPGASSIPVQPTATIGTWDSSVQAQGALYSGHELLSGATMIGTTGIGDGHAGHETASPA